MSEPVTAPNHERLSENDVQAIDRLREIYARLKRELGHDSTWVAGYSNDVMAYIPSLRVLKEGGYEGGGSMPIYGLPTVWGPKIEENIVAEVHRQVEAARARL